MIDILHWVATANPVELQKALPVFVTALVLAVICLAIMFRATAWRRK